MTGGGAHLDISGARATMAPLAPTAAFVHFQRMQRMKMGKRGATASLLILAMAATGAVVAQQPAAPAATKEKSVLTSEREKIGYAIGVDVASSFEPIASEVDVAAMRRAVENAFAGG